MRQEHWTSKWHTNSYCNTQEDYSARKTILIFREWTLNSLFSTQITSKTHPKGFFRHQLPHAHINSQLLTALTTLPKGGLLPLLVLIWGILDTFFLPEIPMKYTWGKKLSDTAVTDRQEGKHTVLMGMWLPEPGRYVWRSKMALQSGEEVCRLKVW